MDLPDPVQIATPFFILLIAVEMLYGWRSGRAQFETGDTATSLIMGLGSLISGAAFASVGLVFYLTAYENRLLDIGYAWWAFALCFIADDLFYYIFHRAAHRVRWFWASHVVHHSSQHYNLSTALRQSWTNPLSLRFIFRIPLFWIGFPPDMVLFCVGINLVYQFWIHTEAIDRLGPIEWIFNTPSHHRIHHATNPRYLDANYAGTLIIWDRMFGTFVPETADDPPQYGIVKNIASFNPLRVAFHEWVALAQDLWRARSLYEVLRYFLAPPGWSPDDSRLTTDAIKAAWRQRQQPT